MSWINPRDVLTKTVSAVVKTVNTANKIEKQVANTVDKVATEVGNSLQNSAKGIVNGWGIVGGGGASAINDARNGVPKPIAVANAVKGAGIGMVGELVVKTGADLAKKAYSYFTGSK
ncbi:hypothetical protein KZ483_27610 [Paenibacillus sp. sptzw28]|uniref:hypothetical protein n=1 Tax=Paenibacillus sp. sptzw28 TaxID=715179 RepID=UPI001C6DF441|nr:hypothetical protein [Paenibacillus sp. sptzw28]QYR21392.1 hypothetical protein KZ483_27610 [Paenibacillus sp. sptzw28]